MKSNIKTRLKKPRNFIQVIKIEYIDIRIYNSVFLIISINFNDTDQKVQLTFSNIYINML